LNRNAEQSEIRPDKRFIGDIAIARKTAVIGLSASPSNFGTVRRPGILYSAGEERHRAYLDPSRSAVSPC